MFFHAYPYTDAHELNLDWLLAQIKAINSTLNNFIVMNTIKYANPFQWNITTQYESNTIVMEPNTGVAYISVQPVPAGISISNTDFWTAVFDLSLLFSNFNDNISFHNEYLNIVSANVYAVDDWLIWKNELYLVTAAISLGDALQPGTNIQRKTVEELVGAITSEITTNILPRLTAAEGDITTINGKLDNYHIINAVEIGCKNDGSEDIANVLNSYVFDPGDTLYFPEGTYLVSSDIPLGITRIIGSNAIIKIDTINKGFKINAKTEITGMNFEGASQDTGVGITISVNGSMSTIDNCTFKDLESGVTIYCSNNCIVSNSNFDRCDVGVLSTGDGADSSEYNKITHCIFNDCQLYNGVFSRKSYYDEIDNCTFVGCGGFGASMQESVFSSIHNNLSINSLKEAYNLQDCTSCTISDNSCVWFNDVGTDFGISVWGTELTSSRTNGVSKENLIQGNIVFGSHKNGIALAGQCFGELVNNNSLIGCSHDTLDMGSGAGIGLGSYGGGVAPYGCTIKNNTICGNGITTYGIKEQGTPNPNTNYYYFNVCEGSTSGDMFSLAGGTEDHQYNVPNT